MYGKPFNHKRPYGEVHGSGLYAFDQDGQLYNAHKQPVDEHGALMPLPPEADTAPAPEAPASPVEATTADDDIPADERPFDILAWAQGSEALKTAPWQKIRAETARLIDDMTAINSKAEARKAILAHYGLPTT